VKKKKKKKEKKGNREKERGPKEILKKDTFVNSVTPCIWNTKSNGGIF
jgi:hypothetical protein